MIIFNDFIFLRNKKKYIASRKTSFAKYEMKYILNIGKYENSGFFSINHSKQINSEINHPLFFHKKIRFKLHKFFICWYLKTIKSLINSYFGT
jgi:hypothetical protein